MATKADFTPDEWKLLLQSPIVAGVAISAADPSGLIGLMKESMASARALIQAETDPNADALVKAVATDFETSAGRGLAQDGVKAAISGAKAPADIVSKALDSLKAASVLLDAKGGPDAPPSRPGSQASPSRSRRPPRKAASSASAGPRSVRRKKQQSLTSPKRLGSRRRRSSCLRFAEPGSPRFSTWGVAVRVAAVPMPGTRARIVRFPWVAFQPELETCKAKTPASRPVRISPNR